MKATAKKFITSILAKQVRQLLKKNKVKVVAVVGSIGKTSTKFAIAQTLESHQKVLWQKGNYNDIVSVPLIFFGHEIPSLFNPFSWLWVFIQNQIQIYNYNYDVVVVELGTDGPDQIIDFKDYLKVDVAVVTAITPEHMENFADLDAVAKEELSVAKFSKELVVNSDLVDAKYVRGIKKPVTTYGQKSAQISIITDGNLEIKKNRKVWIKGDAVPSVMEAYSKTAAAIVASKLKLSVEEIQESIGRFTPVAGRMQILDGIKDSIIIDDTYNASPDACIAALHTLYQRKNKHKIAMLGNMNELGKHSKQEHQRVGNYCDPKQLDLVITVGPDANKYLADSAKNKGCKVKTFDSPYEAGEFVAKNLKKDSLILAKGSQNKVYMEEALKSLLKNHNDQSKLVRQSKTWLKKKKENFKNV